MLSKILIIAAAFALMLGLAGCSTIKTTLHDWTQPDQVERLVAEYDDLRAVAGQVADEWRGAAQARIKQRELVLRLELARHEAEFLDAAQREILANRQRAAEAAINALADRIAAEAR